MKRNRRAAPKPTNGKHPIQTLSAFKPQKRNVNLGKPHGLAALDKSIRRDGYSAPMVAAADGESIYPRGYFDCTVSKIQTLTDGGIRVTLDLPEQATDTAKILMDLRGFALRATIAKSKNGHNGKNDMDLFIKAEAEALRRVSA